MKRHKLTHLTKERKITSEGCASLPYYGTIPKQIKNNNL